MSLLETLLSEHPAPPAATPLASAVAPAAVAPAVEDVAPARAARRRAVFDRLDRIRLWVALVVVWGLGVYLTYQVGVGVLKLDLLPAILFAIAVQGALSGGEMLIYRRWWVGRLCGVALLIVDAGINALGSDTALQGVSIALDVTNPVLWVALVLGAIVATLPEAFYNALKQ